MGHPCEWGGPGGLGERALQHPLPPGWSGSEPSSRNTTRSSGPAAAWSRKRLDQVRAPGGSLLSPAPLQTHGWHCDPSPTPMLVEPLEHCGDLSPPESPPGRGGCPGCGRSQPPLPSRRPGRPVPAQGEVAAAMGRPRHRYSPGVGHNGAQPLGGPLTPAGTLVALLGQGDSLRVPCAQAQPQSTNHGFSAPQH